jgi:hypothetical protein
MANFIPAPEANIYCNAILNFITYTRITSLNS